MCSVRKTHFIEVTNCQWVHQGLFLTALYWRLL